MDITRAFKATIKAVRMRKKIVSGDGTDDSLSRDIMKSRSSLAFRQRSREIVSKHCQLVNVEIEIDTLCNFTRYGGHF